MGPRAVRQDQDERVNVLGQEQFGGTAEVADDRSPFLEHFREQSEVVLFQHHAGDCFACLAVSA